MSDNERRCPICVQLTRLAPHACITDLQDRVAKVEEWAERYHSQSWSMPLQGFPVTAAEPPSEPERASEPYPLDTMEGLNCKVADLEARLASAENELQSSILAERTKQEKGRDEAVLAERARVNGWWMAWSGGRCISKERDEGIASGAQPPGAVKP